jgi:hypothetical protein
VGNSIRGSHVRDRSLDPAEAELWITVIPEHRTATTEVRGRLMGPRCRFSTTVEIAYPLRTFGRKPEGLPELTMRVIIPEASLWEPQSPFLYEGPIELWEDGRQCDLVELSHGLRSFSLTNRGLRFNGRPLTIHAAGRHRCSEEDALRLRQAGCNGLLGSVEAAGLWEIADRLGFLMIGRIPATASPQIVEPLSLRPSSFAWLFSDAKMLQAPEWLTLISLLRDERRQLLALKLELPPSGPLPEEISFVACSETVFPGLATVAVPKIVLKSEALTERDTGAVVPADVMGFIYRGGPDSA